MDEIISKKLLGAGVKEQDLERVIAILSCKTIPEAMLANGRIGGGAGYDQVIAIEFRDFLCKEEFITKALVEFKDSYLSSKEIKEFMSDRQGSYGFRVRLDETKGIEFQERKRIENKMQLFKHNLLREYFGFKS